MQRNALGFEAGVKEAFKYLSGYGFRVLNSETTIVRYASARVFLNVYHGRSSFELGIEIGLLGPRRKTEPGYPLSLLIRVKEPEVAAQFRNVAARTPESVKSGVTMLADQVRKYGQVALQGDVEEFKKLEEGRRRWAEDYAGEVLAEQIRPKAREAFQRQEYAKAADLYQRIRNVLSPGEQKRLEYANKHRKD